MIKHDIIVNNIEKIIKERYDYAFIEKFIEYESFGRVGEVDLLAYDDKHNSFTFYEIKSSHTGKTFRKATEQYNKFCASFPDLDIRGVMVWDKGVKRLHKYE